MVHVYLLKGTNGFYKIGITQNIESRLNTVNTSNPDAISLVTAKMVENAFELEQRLHKKYAKYKTKSNGEWFSFTPEIALEVCIEINKAPSSIIKPVKEVKDLNRILEVNHKILMENHRTLCNDLAIIKKFLFLVRDDNVTAEDIRKEITSLSSDLANTETKKKTIKQPKIDDTQIIEEAKQMILKHNQASASFLQRKLSLGYARAARILDKLADQGFISSGYPRRILPVRTVTLPNT